MEQAFPNPININYLQITSELCHLRGYDFGADRLARIAERAVELVELYANTAMGFHEAVNIDLLLYGDPKCGTMEGILH